MPIIEPPKTLEDFEKVLKSIVELQNNPYLDSSMFDNLLEKEHQVIEKIKELKPIKATDDEAEDLEAGDVK